MKKIIIIFLAMLFVVGCATETNEEQEVIPVIDVVEEPVSEEILREDVTQFSRNPFEGEDTGLIYFEAFESNSVHISDGFYAVRHDRRTSSSSDQMFVGSISEVVMDKTLQISIFGLESPRENFDWECEGTKRVHIRYGLPPTGNTQLISEECLISLEYNSNDDSYTGVISGVFGDGLNTPSEENTVEVQGVIAYKPIRR